MAKQKAPFGADVFSYLTDFQPSMAGFETVVAAQQRNLEALTRANQIFVEGARAVAKRQGEIMKAAMDESADAARSIADARPEEKVTAQAAFTKQAYEKAVAGTRELAEIGFKANTEAFEAINARIVEAFDEVRSVANGAR